MDRYRVEVNGKMTQDIEGWPATRAAVLAAVEVATFGQWWKSEVAEALYMANFATANTARQEVASLGSWSMSAAKG